MGGSAARRPWPGARSPGTCRRRRWPAPPAACRRPRRWIRAAGGRRDAHGGVRIHQPSVAAVHVAHGGQGVGVADRAAAQVGAHGRMIVVEPRQDALEVGGVAHVHGIGQGGEAGVRTQLAGVEVARHHVVAVGGRQEAGHRQPPPGGVHAGGQVAEVAAGHAEQGPPAGAQPHAGEQVVERLRQQAAQADGVGRAQPRRRRQLRIGQRGLHQALAVVEGAGHLQGVDVVAQRGELLLLQAADAARRIEQHHLDTAAAPEGARHGAAGVAGGRDQHHDALSAGIRAERRASSVARNEAPKSLNAQVGPWKSSSRTMPSCSRRRAGANGKASSTRDSAAAAGPTGDGASSSSSNREVAAAATSRNEAPPGRAAISCRRSGGGSGWYSPPPGGSPASSDALNDRRTPRSRVEQTRTSDQLSASTRGPDVPISDT